MITRTTTVGTLKNYRYDLNYSNNTMAKAMNTVITRRSFNSYAEDPAIATRCFQMRRSFLRTCTQIDTNESIRRKYDVAWAAMDTVSQDVDTVANDTVFGSLLTSLNDPDASGRQALGQSMAAKAKSIVQTMNGRYGENYVFAGADTLNAPFTWSPKENPTYIELPEGEMPDPTNPDHAPFFRYEADPAIAGTGVLYTNNMAEAKTTPRLNPDYDPNYDPALDPDADHSQNTNTTAWARYIGEDGKLTDNPDKAMKVPVDNRDQLPWLDADGKPTATNTGTQNPAYYLFKKPDGTYTDEPGDPADPNGAVPNPDYRAKSVYDPNAGMKYLKPDGTGTNNKDEAASTLYYRGIAVDSTDPEDQKKLNYFCDSEKKYVDIGLGQKEKDSEVLSSTVFDSALQGVYYLGGFGTEKVETSIEWQGKTYTTEVEVPNNIVTMVSRMSEILLRCDQDNGSFASKDEAAEYWALAHKFEDTKDVIKQRWDEMDTESSFIRDNGNFLTDTADSISQQFMALEDVDPAAAISDYMFARYCYDAALKVGNSVLSQSLMDYMSF